MNNSNKNEKIKVFLTGGDNSGWALDQDLKQLREFYLSNDFFEIVDFPDKSQIIHSAWWESLYDIDPDILRNRYIVCNISNRPFHYYTRPKFSLILPIIDKIIVQSDEAKKEFDKVGKKTFQLTYTLDEKTYFPYADEDKKLVRKKYQLPIDKYIIGNFHRDSEGKNLNSPKTQKGADIFLEIVRKVWKDNKNIHILLAGPRRHWLKSQLIKAGITFTYIGKEMKNDDWNENILSKEKINELYQALDLVIVSSRWEGGPRSVLEAAATKTKIISPRVGIAEDVLVEKCLFSTFIEACEMIKQDIKNNFLADTVEIQYTRLRQKHTVNALRDTFKQLGEEIKNEIMEEQLLKKRKKSIRLAMNFQHKCILGVWHNFTKPPFGGGNQFMIALSKEMKKRGIKVLANKFKNKIGCYLVNSVQFDHETFLSEKRNRHIKLIHRIDGPIQKYRDTDKELDELCHKLNQDLADVTVVQSEYVFTENVNLGFSFINPVIIKNAADNSIFNTDGKTRFNPHKKIRLISTSWSDNPKKGGLIYKWLDENLDFSKYEYTFVGRIKENFKNIKIIAPVPSKRLAEILKQHDIYITASDNDPCSNALVEALSCGLPAVYYNRGGHPELVNWGGLGFEEKEDIPFLIQKIAENYRGFQNLIKVNSIKQVGTAYEEIIRMVSPDKSFGIERYFMNKLKLLKNKFCRYFF